MFLPPKLIVLRERGVHLWFSQKFDLFGNVLILRKTGTRYQNYLFFKKFYSIIRWNLFFVFSFWAKNKETAGWQTYSIPQEIHNFKTLNFSFEGILCAWNHFFSIFLLFLQVLAPDNKRVKKIVLSPIIKNFAFLGSGSP